MSHNPYTPPTAVVADIQTEPLAERPKQVDFAVKLLWCSVLIGLLPQFQRYYLLTSVGEMSVIIFLITTLFSVGLALLLARWFIGKIALGRNWARIVMLVVFVCGLAFLPFVISGSMGLFTTFNIIVLAVQTVLQTIAVGLVFVGPGKHWFQRRA